MKPTVAGIPGDPRDVAAIVELVATVQHAQQQALPDEFMRAFREDAIWTTAHGKQLTGHEINEFTHRVLPAAAEAPVTATYRVEHILFIRPDVAAVKLIQRPIMRDGRRVEFDAEKSPEQLVIAHPDAIPGSPLYVLAKDGSEWQIAAAQNTKVVDPERLADIAEEVTTG